MNHTNDISVKLRISILKMIYNTGSGHIGSSFSSVEILIALYFYVMNTTIDKFVLSKGHAAPALYAILHQKNILSKNDLQNFRKINGITQGHPDMLKTPGIDMSSGSLGNGLSAAVGFAIGQKYFQKIGKTYVLIGDGEVQEGIVWESALIASNYKLSNLIVFMDRNHLQINGSTDHIMDLGNLKLKWKSFGWNVHHIKDGHSVSSIISSLNNVENNSSPTIIITETIKGKGVSFMENRAEWHSKVPTHEEYEKALDEIKGNVYG